MDTSPESLHSILLDLNIPASLEDCRNPTENFIVNIITEFFQLFYIDVATVKKASLQQLEALNLVGAENAGIISLINLTEAMSTFGSAIFMKDFTLTDITSPRPKATRRNLKLLANFTLYMRNTKSKMQVKIDEVLNRGNVLNDLKKKNQETIANINKLAAEIAAKKANNERIKYEIEEIQQRIENRKGQMSKLDAECKTVKQQKQQMIERNQAKRSEVKKLESITEQLKAKVVFEPETYHARLRELEEECKAKKEERTLIDDKIQCKKPIIQSLESALGVVERQHAKLPDIIDLHKKLLELNQTDGSLKTQVEEATHQINTESNLDEEDKKKITEEELKKCELRCEENLSKLRATHLEMSMEKKTLERQLAEMESRQYEISSERDGIYGKITEIAGDISQFLQQYKDVYNQEVREILDLEEYADRCVKSFTTACDTFEENCEIEQV